MEGEGGKEKKTEIDAAEGSKVSSRNGGKQKALLSYAGKSRYSIVSRRFGISKANISPG